MGRLVVLVVALAVTISACAPPPAPRGNQDGATSVDQRAPKRITVAIRGDPKTLSAKLNSEAGAGGVPGVGEIAKMLNAGLATDDAKRVLHAQLAEDVPSIENGLWRVFPDGRMETTWRIRAGVLWHDGAPFTSDDLIFTATVEQDPDLPIFRNVAYGAIASVEAPDPSTVRMTWKRPYIEADTMFTSQRALPMPRHLLERTYLENKEDFTNLPYWNRDFIGTGPYKLRELTLGSHLILDANDRFVLGRPKIDQIEVRFIPDPNTIAANILAGGIDTTLGGRLSLEWGLQVRDQWRDGKLLSDSRLSMISAYPQFLNPDPPIVADARFRRALLYAIDRQQIIDSLVAGLAPFGHSIIADNHAEWKDVESSIVKYEFDPRQAMQLIEGLGYTRAADGFYRDASNQRLSVEVRTQATDDTQMKVTFSMADYWQRTGVAVDQAPFPQQRASDREFRATRPAFEVVRQPGGWWELERFYGPNTPLPENNFTGVNRTRHRNPEFDGWIDQFLVTVPVAERVDILKRIVRYMTDQVVILPIFWDPTPIMVANRLKNIAEPGEVWDVHMWDVG
jgi:peptide/nickel transport system substrate-binding protein